MASLALLSVCVPRGLSAGIADGTVKKPVQPASKSVQAIAKPVQANAKTVLTSSKSVKASAKPVLAGEHNDNKENSGKTTFHAGTVNTRLEGSVSEIVRASPFLYGSIEVVPKGTKINLSVMGNLNSQLSKPGDEVLARVAGDVEQATMYCYLQAGLCTDR